jgi:ATP-binding cassette subfamily G (WHITE) protein 2 (SNQ2)
MFHTVSGRMYAAQDPDQRRLGIPLHNPENYDAEYSAHPSSHPNNTGPVPDSQAITPDGATQPAWGERDAGGPVDLRVAMQEFEDMRRELSTISRTKSRRSQSLGRRQSSALQRVWTRESRKSRTTTGADIEAQESDEEHEAREGEDEFVLDAFLKDGHLEKRTDDGKSAKKVGVVFRDLTVYGSGATATFAKTLPSAILGTFGPDLYRLACRFIPSIPRAGGKAETRVLLHSITGVVRNGEMLLVLGKPGSGCSTFLKTIANQRDEYASVSGDVHYGGISAEEQAKHYRGEVAYNEEDDLHFPTLTVGQTLLFSLLNKTKRREKGEIPVIISALLRMFGISHTRHTLVGDAYVRGVSGGERKRVSIAETLATKSTVVAWDNSTRGLDASTALDYANSLRVMTDVSNRTTLVTLYQAGEGIYELVDKVLVLDEGRMVYQGAAKDAKAYFESLGYLCLPRQTTADFLTACTDATSRRFNPDVEAASIPKGAEQLEQAFRESESYRMVVRDVEDYEAMLKESDFGDARQFKETVAQTKSKHVSSRSPYTVSFFRQVLACTRREMWLTLGDRTTLYTKFFIIVSNALIVSSLFHGQSLGTSGAFSRGGSLFFSILFLGWLQLGELMKAVSGREIIKRHGDYAFYRPSAVVVARVVQDVPMLLIQVAIFSVIVYFLAGLDLEAGKFFIYTLFIYTTTFCVTAMYRMFAALSPSIDDAVRFSGIGLNLLIIYVGYVIPKPLLLGQYIWFGWLYWINPISYAFEGVLGNEFAGRSMRCEGAQVVPSGPGYEDPRYQGCALNGAVVGSLDVDGAAYLDSSFNYSRGNLWRNFGVIVAFTVLYIVITVVASEWFNFSKKGGGALEFKPSSAAAKRKIASEAKATAGDVEKSNSPNAEKTGATTPKAAPAPTSGTSSQAVTLAANSPRPSSSKYASDQDESLPRISGSQSVFTWSNVTYTVPYLGGERKLLNSVSGYAKPGLMVALMGASGAGKTTLLNTLSQRQKVGVVTGEMRVDGSPLGREFARGTGFCEQSDLHDGNATVREAVEFSAILRQERSVPREEKLAYVQQIIELLELEEIQDVLIRSLGVEQRKRVTIGVELAAKPSLLLFLDEPTSGLDAQSAYSIVRFLKKLARAGQAIVCTIHQPSSILIQEFDMILALNPGGNTFYFGPVGENGDAVVKYFSERGVTCPPEKNVAEFILETAAKGGRRRDGTRINWNDEWLRSNEARGVNEEIARLCRDRSAAESADQSSSTKKEAKLAFASPVYLQTQQLTLRLFRNYWRDPSYLYGKLFVSVIIGLFNGFTFYMLGNTYLDMQNRLFTSFLIILIPPTIVNAVVPKFYQQRALWEAREYPARIYGWVAFCTANIVAEIPFALLSGLLYWALWYWPTGLPSAPGSSLYSLLMCLLFFLFQASWGQWITGLAPNFTVIANVLPFFFVVFGLFNGVVQPPTMMPPFWRDWLYWLNPSTHWLRGVLSATLLQSTPVVCAANEMAKFRAPPGQTCEGYAAAFVQRAGQGYLTTLQEAGETVCAYCPAANGAEFLGTLGLAAGVQWSELGYFCAYVVSNMALVYVCVYTVRVRGWTFGFGMLAKGVKSVKGRVGGKRT